MKYEVIDNFFNVNEFKWICNIIEQESFPWNLIKKANDFSTDEKQFQLYHETHLYGREVSPFSGVLIRPIMQRLKELKGYQSVGVTRAKINCFIKSDENLGLGFHRDIEDTDEYSTILLYLDTNNGYTELKTGEKIPTIANSALIFPAHELHQTVTQTDTMYRKNININFKEL